MEKGQAVENMTFAHLTPETILEAVEQELGVYLSNLCRPLNSYINRVYELEDEDGEGVIAKFFRPGRWSKEALAEEHQFLTELAAEEVPVIAPLTLENGTTLGNLGGIFFSVYPKKGGRYVDELTLEQWMELGRLMGRVHMIGASAQFTHRPTLHPSHSTRDHLHYILSTGLLPQDMVARYKSAVEQLIELAEPLFAGNEHIRIHGDCHSGNLIYRPGESYFLIDFDDTATGPPVQDFWMLLPGDTESAFEEIDAFMDGYETFRHFDQRSLALIEPLRGMRFVHYSAWCAWQAKEDGCTQVVANFGTRSYWQQEILDLEDQVQQIRGRDPLPFYRIKRR